MQTPSIIDCMTDEELFEPSFRGTTWNGWHAVLKGGYALPMNETEKTFFRSVAERDPPTKQVKEMWIIAGRRSGKDSIASLIAAYSGALFDHSDRLRPGERAMIMCLAVDREQAKIVLNYTRAYFNDIELLRDMVQRETANGFELTNNVDIAISTNSHRTVRGRPIHIAIFDECAFWRSEESATPDEEVYAAIKPALASIPGSMIIGITTAYKKSGLAYKKCMKHYGKSGDVLVIKAPTRVLNPTIDQSIIDDAMEDDPAAARAEWFSIFRDDVGGWLELETIEAAVDRGVTVRPPLPNLYYRSGVDASGGRHDSFTAAIAHDEKDGTSVPDCGVELNNYRLTPVGSCS